MAILFFILKKSFINCETHNSSLITYCICVCGVLEEVLSLLFQV